MIAPPPPSEPPDSATRTCASDITQSRKSCVDQGSAKTSCSIARTAGISLSLAGRIWKGSAVARLPFHLSFGGAAVHRLRNIGIVELASRPFVRGKHEQRLGDRR